MKRVNLDNKHYVDLDKFVLLEIKEFHYIDPNGSGKVGFQVVGITDYGGSVVLTEDLSSGKPEALNLWIANNWLKK